MLLSSSPHHPSSGWKWSSDVAQNVPVTIHVLSVKEKPFIQTLACYLHKENNYYQNVYSICYAISVFDSSLSVNQFHIILLYVISFIIIIYLYIMLIYCTNATQIKSNTQCNYIIIEYILSRINRLKVQLIYNMFFLPRNVEFLIYKPLYKISLIF